MIRILIVSGIRLYREGLRLLLSQNQNFEVVGTASSIDELLDSAETLSPDLVLLDLALNDGLPAAQILMKNLPDLPIVALGVPAVEQEIISCIEVGIAGYVFREASVADLTSTLVSAARGELHCSARVAGALRRRVAALTVDREQKDEVREALTRREWEVSELVAQGLTNKEIAARLTIEVATVKNHVHKILQKLSVHNRGEAAAMVRRRTWRSPFGDATR